MADKYAIYLGTSHCEPMMRNTNGEWRKTGKGEYNYLTNKENVLSFWEERVKLLQHSDNIYTLGMRGVHDSGMLGAKTVEDQKEALTRPAQYVGEIQGRCNESASGDDTLQGGVGRVQRRASGTRRRYFDVV